MEPSEYKNTSVTDPRLDLEQFNHLYIGDPIRKSKKKDAIVTKSIDRIKNYKNSIKNSIIGEFNPVNDDDLSLQKNILDDVNDLTEDHWVMTKLIIIIKILY